MTVAVRGECESRPVGGPGRVGVIARLVEREADSPPRTRSTSQMFKPLPSVRTARTTAAREPSGESANPLGVPARANALAADAKFPCQQINKLILEYCPLLVSRGLLTIASTLAPS
jgi:hypothetical protein